MRTLVRRRLQNASLAFLAVALAAAWAGRLELRLRDSSYFTGWLLLAAILFLALFQLRKKLPAPPLGSATLWLQCHIYVGLATAGLYFVHAPLRWPNGRLESLLATLLFATLASGIVGLYWTRTLPRKLSRVGEEVLYERIAAIRGALRQRAETAVLAAVRLAGATTLGEFYSSHLQAYFSDTRSWKYRLVPTATHRRALMAELTEASRYFSDAERQTAEELFALVRKRDDLDYHEALLWRLRAWLFVHIGLTYPLLVFAGLHAWLAHVFRGGTP